VVALEILWTRVDVGFDARVGRRSALGSIGPGGR